MADPILIAPRVIESQVKDANGSLITVEQVSRESGVWRHLVSALVNSLVRNKTLARAYLTSNQAINHNTPTVVVGYTESKDIGGNFNPDTGIYYAPVAGLYHVDYSVLFYDAESKLTIAAAYLYLGVAAVSTGTYWSGTDKAYAGSSGGDIIEMAAGDGIYLVGLMQTSDSSAVVMLAGVNTRLAVHLIST